MKLFRVVFLILGFMGYQGSLQGSEESSWYEWFFGASSDEPPFPADEAGGAAGGGGASDGASALTHPRVFASYQQATGLWPDKSITLRDCRGDACVEIPTTWENVRVRADGTNCGYHALKNAYCVLMYHQTHDDVWLRNMQTSTFLLTLLQPWLEYTVPYRSVSDAVQYGRRPLGNWPSTDELNRLIGIIENPKTEQRVKTKLTEPVYTDLQTRALQYGNSLMEHALVPSDYITVVDKLALFGFDTGADQMITDDAIQVLQKIKERFASQENAIHTFIVNTSAAHTHGQSGVHWITMVMYKEDKKVKWAFTSSLPGYTEIIPYVQKTFDFSMVNVRDIKQRSLVASNADVIARFEQQVDDFYHANLSLTDRIRSLFGYTISRFEERKVLLQSILQKLYHSTFIDAMQVSEYKEKISSIIRGLLYFLDENQKVYFAELYDMSLDENKPDIKTMPAILEKMYNNYRAVDAHIFAQMDETLQSLGLVEGSSGEEVYEQGGPIDFGEDDLHL